MSQIDAVEPTTEELEHLPDAVVGLVTLRAGDLDALADFYQQALGFQAAPNGDPNVAELTDATGRPLLRLDATATAGKAPAMAPRTGLFHTAFRFADRASLGACVVRAFQAGAEFQGASDHAVSEAIYLGDAEGNGIELYRDRRFDEWPIGPDGAIGMVTEPLDVQALIHDAGDPSQPSTCDIGHIHLKASDTERTAGFYADAVGLDIRAWYGSSAAFLAEGLYHHHLGANSWHSRGAGSLAADEPGLAGYELRLRDESRVEAAAERLETAAAAVERIDGGVGVIDPDGTRVVILSR